MIEEIMDVVIVIEDIEETIEIEEITVEDNLQFLALPVHQKIKEETAEDHQWMLISNVMLADLIQENK